MRRHEVHQLCGHVDTAQLSELVATAQFPELGLDLLVVVFLALIKPGHKLMHVINPILEIFQLFDQLIFLIQHWSDVELEQAQLSEEDLVIFLLVSWDGNALLVGCWVVRQAVVWEDLFARERVGFGEAGEGALHDGWFGDCFWDDCSLLS